MAGSKQRATILGNTVLAEPEIIERLRKMRSDELKPFFDQAKDHGSSPFMLGNEEFFLHRQADHTFLCQPGAHHRTEL